MRMKEEIVCGDVCVQFGWNRNTPRSYTSSRPTFKSGGKVDGVQASVFELVLIIEDSWIVGDDLAGFPSNGSNTGGEKS
jgi:hypothetical protein